MRDAVRDAWPRLSIRISFASMQGLPVPPILNRSFPSLFSTCPLGTSSLESKALGRMLSVVDTMGTSS